jgi:DNA (cytosine-5)-methyltransferase 1
MFTFIDLFCGMGGFHRALASLGGNCVFASDIDKDCQNSYEINFGMRPVGDIRSVKPEDIPDHDVLCGGFPCQPFSTAGHRNAFEDTRGT